MHFTEGPDGQLVPLEGEELKRAREDAWRNDPLQFADAYFDSLPSNRVEFVKFCYYLSSLVWLYRTVSAQADVIARSQEQMRATGEHRVPGWEGESDMVLDEEAGLLAQMRTISAGSVIASAATALETLATDLLDRPEDTVLHGRGLRQKIDALIRRWPDLPNADAIREKVAWIAERRNSFAHSLLDEVEPSWRPRQHFVFDEEAVDEAFTRVGEVAATLAAACG